MNSSQLKILAIVLLVVAGVLAFAGIERYQANAGNVQAFNNFMQGSPLAGAFGRGDVQPAVPASSKYCALGAVICAAAGLVALAKSKREHDAPRAQ